MWAKPEPIEIVEYAELRMKRRDILLEEVEETLNCPCNHELRRDGLWEVKHPLAGKVLLVVYRRGTNARYVLNTMWE